MRSNLEVCIYAFAKGIVFFLFMLLITCFGAHNTQAFGTSSKIWVC